MQKHIDKLYSKPLSWSAISSWEWNQEEWATKYLDGLFTPPTPKMSFGNVVGDRLAKDPEYLPEVPRYSVFEHKMYADIGDIKLVGLLDSFDPETKNFYEYKTSSNENKWDQDEANKHGQILLYLFLIYVNYRVPPEKIKIKLVYIPVEENFDGFMEVSKGGKIQSFDVNHTLEEALVFIAKKVKPIWEEMKEYARVYEGVVDNSVIINK
jgi:hypothetical protein